LQEDYVKIGLRRLQLASEYNGEKLQKEVRTFEIKRRQVDNQVLSLFG